MNLGFRPFAGVVAAATLGLALVGCGGPAPEVDVPDVRGVALNQAQEILEEAGFKQIEDEDHLEDRAIIMSSNWVVVEQSPGPGETVPVDAEVRLFAAKIDDAGVVDLLPEGSPVAIELQEQAAEDERGRQEQEAADAARAEQEAAEVAAAAEAAAQEAAAAQGAADAAAAAAAAAQPAAPAAPSLDPHFGTCKEAIANGYGPYVSGVDPEYDWYRDGDSDGVDCER